MLSISYADPTYFGDANDFLNEFINHEFLNFMGVIVTITLASTANIHIELRKKEEKAGTEFLTETKDKVKKSAFSLIWVLALSVLVVVAKPLLPDSSQTISIVNGIGLILVLWGILVIYDITKLAFKM